MISHDLKTCIKEFSGITDFQTINAIAINHVVNNLDDIYIEMSNFLNFTTLLLLKVKVSN